MMSELLKKNFYLIGVFSTLGALMINVGGTAIAFVNLLLLTSVVMQIINGNCRIYKYKWPLLLLALGFILSSINGLFILNKSWISESMKFVIKFLIFLFPFVILYSDEEILYYRKYFFKGLFVSCCIQLLWEFAQIVAWTKFNVSINEVIFGKLLKIEIKNSWTFISDGRFRPAGVSWEPANLALSLVIGFILSKNVYYKVLFVIGIVLSTSRTGIIVLAFVMLINALINRRYKKSKKIVKKKDILLAILFCVILIAGMFYISNNPKEIVEYVTKGIQTTYNKMTNLNVDSSALTHSQYYKKIWYVFSKGNLLNDLIGYGTSSSGFAYSKFLSIYTEKIGWNPESDFITLLFGNGVLGVIAYYASIILGIKYNIKDKNACLMIISIAFSGIFYLYIRGSWTIIILFMLFVKNKDTNNEINLVNYKKQLEGEL